jgi:flavin reductase (DIM6/NTAB) family NADH-FMN oxidoreductase RutF
MWFDMSLLDKKRSYKLLTATVVPRPIAWVVTLAEDGTPNAALFSFFNFFSGFPPVICVGIGNRENGPKDTLNNIVTTKEFVINMVSEETVSAMNTTAVAFPPNVDELSVAGLVVCFAIDRTQKRVFSRHASLQILAIAKLSLWFASSLTRKSIAFVSPTNYEADY